MRIKLISDLIDKDENGKSYVKAYKDSVIEVSDEYAAELIESKDAEAVKIDKSVKVVEDEKVSIALAVEKAVAKETKEDKAVHVEVTKDAPLWKDVGEFLGAIKKAAKGNVDERLYKGSGEGQEEADNTEGGYLVEHRIGNEIYAACQQSSILLPKCQSLEIGPNANGMKINQVNETARSATNLFGGIRIYSPAEGAAKTPFIQLYAQVDMDLGKYCAVNYMTDELMQDRVALRSFIGANVGQAFAWVIDDDILHGTTNAAMVAIENHASTVQVAVAGDNPTTAELMDMYVAMLPCAVSGAEWYMSLVQYAAVSQLESTAGQRVVMPDYRISPYGTLFGRPVNIIEQADVAANDTSIMFLNLKYYLTIKKGGIDEATSIHVKFLEDETAFRWTMRMGGSPILASTVTLPDGSIVSGLVTRD